MNNENQQRIGCEVDSIDNKVIVNYDYVLEEINVMQKRVEELEEDRRLLYQISQEQKARINELNARVRDYNRGIYSIILIVICVLLLISYFTLA